MFTYVLAVVATNSYDVSQNKVILILESTLITTELVSILSTDESIV